MTHFTLALEFDVNQITRSLQHTFQSFGGFSNEKFGALAGTAHFEAGDEMSVSVTATGQSSDKLNVVVTNCSIVSIGTANLGKFFLSPFCEKSAVSSVQGWGPTDNTTTPADQEAGRQRLFTESTSVLPVAATNGQWQFSGYLSVLIEINGKTYYRLFDFDPEGSVGNGGGFGWPDNV